MQLMLRGGGGGGGVLFGGRKGLEFSVVHEVTHFCKSAMINMMCIVHLPK